ncbi:MAG: ABC transporter permease subunit [Chloroflexi bacterium]|nr:ABC transporter permease subunit [Chloroflexota bacterium]MYC47051.1 ABC transporter permease subunit [Chloroflexota bacterium]
MLTEVIRLTLWEWRKLRHRWMPWILLAVILLLMQAAQWFTYAAYHNESLQEFTSSGSHNFSITEEVDGESIRVTATCASLENEGLPQGIEQLSEERQAEFLAELAQWQAENCTDTLPTDEWRGAFTIPRSITESAPGVVGLAPILLIILAASHVGSEYGLGTLRPALTRGAGRWHFLASKLVLLMLLSIAATAVIAAATAIASLIAAVLPPEETGTLADSGKWSDAFITLAKMIYAFVPYIRLSVCLAVLAQSASAGIAIALGYYVIELIAAPILTISVSGQRITDFLLRNNIDEWMDSAFISVEINGASSAANQPESLQAFLVISAYTLVFCVAAFWVFLRRDIAGAKGE